MSIVKARSYRERIIGDGGDGSLALSHCLHAGEKPRKERRGSFMRKAGTL